MKNENLVNKLRSVLCFFVAISIAGMAVSITLSHVFIILSCFLALPYFYLAYSQKLAQAPFSDRKQVILSFFRENVNRRSLAQIPKPFIVGFSFYTFIFLYKVIHSLKAPQTFSFDTFGAVWSDVFLLFFALIVWKLGSDHKNLGIFYLSLFCFIGLILLTGILAVFRFGDPFLSLFGRVIDTPYLFSWGGLDFHRGSGFIRVPLTYGCLLAMSIPFLVGSLFYFLSRTKRYFITFFLFFLNCCAFFLLWSNGTRSASLALLLSSPIILYFIIKDFFIKKKPNKKFFSSPKTAFFGIAFVFACLWLIVSHLGTFKDLNSPYKRNINIRSFIWTQSGQMFLENPILGVGPGNYEKSSRAQLDIYYRETERTTPVKWIPTGHAHSDILHFGAIGGLPLALFFVYLIYTCIHFLFQKRSWPGAYLLCSSICFFIAGLAECYFLDSEVVFLFWILLSLGSASSNFNPFQKKEGVKDRGHGLESLESNGNGKGKVLTSLSLLSLRRSGKDTKLKKIQKERLLLFIERAILVSSVLAIVTISFSLSASFFFIVLSFLFWILNYIFNSKGMRKGDLDSPTQEKRIPQVFLMALALFGVIFFSDIYNFIFNSQAPLSFFAILSLLSKGDFVLMLFGILLWHLGGEKNKLRIIRKSFTLLASLLVLFGIISLFLDLPLSSIALGQKEYTSFNPPQNFLFHALGIKIYSPQGFMSTRLTYAGMLILVLPYLVGEALERFSKKNYSKTCFYILVFSLGFLILWFTGVRSALLGFIASLFILLWSLRSRLKLLVSNRLAKGNKKGLGYILVAFCFFIVLSFILASQVKLDSNIFRSVLRLSDFGRALMWTESGEGILENPILGVGNSNYFRVSSSWRDSFLEANPDTWYFMNFIPRGHVHSDILDLWYKHGVFAVLFFLAILFLILKHMSYPLFKKGMEKSSIFLFTGCTALFFAGFAQCYLLDNEVGLVFWITLAIALRTNPKSSDFS